jgi:hypothetical protein
MDKIDYTALAERLGSQIDGIECDVVIPLLTSILGEVAVQSGTPKAMILAYVNAMISGAYDQHEVPDGVPIQ